MIAHNISECNCKECALRPLFFNHTTKEQYSNLCNSKTEKQYRSGEIIINEGEEIKDFLYLKDGLVKLFRKGKDNNDQIITFACPFDFVSLLSIFSDTKFRYSVSALHDSTVCMLDIEMVRSLCRKNGEVAMEIMEKMSNISDEIINQFLNIRQKHLRGRIAFVLLYFSEKIFKSNSFDLPVSRREIAEYIGMTTENVIRILSEFRKDSIIGISGKSINIKDEKRLKVICDLG